MSLRAKLFVLITLTVFLAVAAVTALVSVTTTRSYEAMSAGHSQALADDFQREFKRRAEALTARGKLLADSDAAAQLAAEMNAAHDTSEFVDSSQRFGAPDLDILEFLDSAGTIISSRQWPARFGYKESWFSPALAQSVSAFLQAIDLPAGPSLALITVQPMNAAQNSYYLVAGQRLDENFTRSLQPPPGFAGFIDTGSSIIPLGAAESRDFNSAIKDHAASGLQSMFDEVRAQKRPVTREVSLPLSSNGTRVVLHAYPLFDRSNNVLALLVVASSNADLLRLDRRIRSSAALVALIGIILAILLSSLLAARITQPIQTLAAAADEVARGDLGTQVDDRAEDEIGRLAYAFNRMTRELLDQREKLVQSERVAAWRELARRLAHELKNPLFPLQITVENLLRAREQNPAQFEEVFRESTATLLAEIDNLKQIIARFSDFSKMPAPELQPVNVNDAVRNALRVYEPQLNGSGRAPIVPALELQETLDREKINADPALLHRALSNLILNALDAMPNGGKLTLRTREQDGAVQIQIGDTGVGLTPEERDRIFTPYYTSKQHGTGLGLAIVQSIVSDHGGRICVESRPQQGSTFIIELPRR